MSLRTNVSQKWFNPGTTVSGTVSLSGEQDVDIRILNIRFVGCCETYVLVLYQDDFVPVDGSQHSPGPSFPFNFTVPAHSLAKQPSPWAAQAGSFEINHSQPLPASFSDQCTHGTARVSYTLIATLQSWKPKVPDTVVTKVLTLPPAPRHIQSPDAQFVQHTQIVTIRSRDLDPEYTNKPLSLKEKFLPKRKSKLPFAASTVNLQTPTVSTIRKPLPLILSLSDSTTSSSLSSKTTLPPTYLKNFTLHLLATTKIQYPSLKDPETLKTKHCTTSHTLLPTYPPSNSISNPLLLPLTSPPLSIHLSSFLNPLIPVYHAPNFRTFDISRSYALRIKLSIEYAKQKCSPGFTVEDFTLLAGGVALPYEERDEERGRGGDGEEGPPPYERMADEGVRREGEKGD